MVWHLFVLPIALFGAGTSLLKMSNGGTFLVITMAADQWQRRRRHKAGEGVFTDREGGHVYGLRVARDGNDLGQFIDGLTHAFPEMFEEFKGVHLDLTVSEGRDLRELVQAAQGPLGEYLELLKAPTVDGEELGSMEELNYREEQLRLSLRPIATYLRNVPASRKKN